MNGKNIDLVAFSFNGENEKVFTEMYIEYIEDLSLFNESFKDSPVTKEEVNMNLCNSENEIYFISLDDKFIGFAVIGIRDNKHPESDFFIGEFCVLKEYQKQGFGRRAAAKLLSLYKGRACLYIIENNMPAHMFWDRVFTENGYTDVSEDFYNFYTPEKCVFIMYEKLID